MPGSMSLRIKRRVLAFMKPNRKLTLDEITTIFIKDNKDVWWYVLGLCRNNSTACRRKIYQMINSSINQDGSEFHKDKRYSPYSYFLKG